MRQLIFLLFVTCLFSAPDISVAESESPPQVTVLATHQPDAANEDDVKSPSDVDAADSGASDADGCGSKNRCQRKCRRSRCKGRLRRCR
jgi:hypothetical protein